MDGLGLLCDAYDDDEDGDEEEEYDKKSDFKDGKDLKRKRQSESGQCCPKKVAKSSSSARLPLPGSLKDMFNDCDDDQVKDDPSKHQGRSRSFAHVRGNWATHVYIDVTSKPGELDRVQRRLCNLLPSVLGGEEVHPVPDPHLSLSRTVVVKHHWIEPLSDSLKEKGSKQGAFKVSLGGLEVFANEEGSRTFVAVSAKPCRSLESLLGVVDEALVEFGLPRFYRPARFHVSLVWVLGDRREDLIGSLGKLEDGIEDDMSPFRREVLVEEIRCKMGNKIMSFPLN